MNTPIPNMFRRWLVVAAVMVALPAPVALASSAAETDPPAGVSTTPSLHPTPKLIKPDARGVAWGNPAEGSSLGDGTSLQRLSPVLIDGGSLLDDKVVSDVDPGSSSACALAVGRVYCWGDNSRGQLGNGLNITHTNSPVAVGGVLFGQQVTAISVGGRHACAIANFHVYCWGSNVSGQLGIGDDSVVSSNTPVAVDSSGVLAGKRVTSVSAGYDHTCVVAASKAYCWGLNTLSQIGDGTTTKRPVPTEVDGDVMEGPVDSISAGDKTTCAIVHGAAYCWGLNNRGQVGAGAGPVAVDSPTAVVSDGALQGVKVTSVSVGSGLTCATAGSGASRRAFCWGIGGHLGINTQTDASVPVAVSTGGALKDKTISGISVYNGGGCVVFQGQGACWGDGDHGQIGDGTTNSSPVPVKVDTSGVSKNLRLLGVSSGYDVRAAVGASPASFSDVPKGYVFEDDILWAAGVGVTTGNPDGSFHPAEAISRQAMAAFLFRDVNPGVADPQCAGMSRVFVDVGTDDLFCGQIEWLVHAGIVKVSVDKHFDPTGVVDRGTMADWLFRSRHPGVADQVCAPGSRIFSDVPVGGGCGNIEWLARSGITTGYPDGQYKSGNSVNRDSMAAFFHRKRALVNPH